jgi:hypothetical protein
MWTAIALIVIACVIGETVRKKYEAKNGAIDEERLAELEARLENAEGLRERIEVLERIVTDRKENLKREFDYLDKAS